MKNLSGKYAVVTGAGSGIGRALALQLVEHGSHVALCDIQQSSLEQTLALCHESNHAGSKLISYRCDVADKSEVDQFPQFVASQFGIEHINLLINNAGVNGGGSFVTGDRAQWERTFSICWNGVYLMTRAFMPMLLASEEGHVVNMSSANGLRAVLGGHVPHTAYSSAKFAVRGFSESLIHDFRFNAPHLNVSVVMPGHTGTDILVNSHEVLGQNIPENWDANDIDATKTRWKIAGNANAHQMSDDDVRRAGRLEATQMRELGMPADDVAKIILDGVQTKKWRILVGDDTHSLDQLVRESPEAAYDEDFVDRWRIRTKDLNS